MPVVACGTAPVLPNTPTQSDKHAALKRKIDGLRNDSRRKGRRSTSTIKLQVITHSKRHRQLTAAERSVHRPTGTARLNRPRSSIDR